MAGKKELHKYDVFFHSRGKKMLWLVYMVPLFPSDIITYITGLSDMKLREFIFFPAIFLIPNLLILNYFGNIFFESPLKTIIIGGIIFLFFAAVMFLVFFPRKKG